jgi:hypothetical protein
MSQEPKQGDLRVWWVPQVPCAPFHAAVASPSEAKPDIVRVTLAPTPMDHQDLPF